MLVFLKNIALRALLVLVALQILNLGIDAIDFQPIASTNTIGDFNYINSMAEYVAEIVMGHKDAFPEYHQESTSSKSQLVKHFSLKLYQPVSAALDLSNDHRGRIAFAASINQYHCPFYKEINPPPPKLILS